MTHQEIERLLSKITPGEWGKSGPDGGSVNGCFYIQLSDQSLIAEVYDNPMFQGCGDEQGFAINNAEFIAASPRLVRELLDELKMTRRALELANAELIQQEISFFGRPNHNIYQPEYWLEQAEKEGER